MERTRHIFIAIFALVALVTIGLLMGLMWRDLQRVNAAKADADALSTVVAQQAATLTHIANATPVATATPLPTPTALPDRFATASAEAVATTAARPDALAIAKRWPLLQRELFDNNDAGWATDGGVDSNLSTPARAISNGEFSWDVKAIEELTWVEPLPDTLLTERFYLSVDIAQNAPHTTDQGVLFRYQDASNDYLFGLCERRGEIGTYRRVDGDWIAIQNCRLHDAVRIDEQNRLTVVGQSGYYQFFINDMFVSDLWDRTFESGQVGLYIEASAGDETVFRFDNLEIRSAELGR